MATPAGNAHLNYLRQCLSLAERSPPRATNFRVGALLVQRRDESGHTTDDRILSTGYTLELPGNTHAEQCCLLNFAAAHAVRDDDNDKDDCIAEALPSDPIRRVLLYVTMEPCARRLSGQTPCVQRILQTRTAGRRGIDKVYFGVREPDTFVGESQGCRMLTAAGVEWEHVAGLEEEILAVAMAGHDHREDKAGKVEDGKEGEGKQGKGRPDTDLLLPPPLPLPPSQIHPHGGTNIDDITPEERRRQEQLPRNPKKRMMMTEVNFIRGVPSTHQPFE
ncbi:hypothetical protein Egran_01712 [Elaphomyces granulatus]|uniref:CMP/dCMP-type deaminase domain-containing protein n=1 Tax=Elaphomyces granulatus TaxID=519963 RepID=A0A232M357_9EURO|nr:hypothetical protein Egran_01712 [Elaphomyces granulatus]